MGVVHGLGDLFDSADISDEVARTLFRRVEAEETHQFDDEGVESEGVIDFDEFLSWLYLTLRVRFAHRNEGFARRVNDWLLTLDAPPPPAMPEPETPTAKGKGKKK